MAHLTEDDLMGHVMIVGASGAGKTNLLLYMMQHIAKSKKAGIIFIDPHGDASLQLKATVPETTVFDPVYAPFALNPMDLGEYSSKEERKVMVQRRVGELVNMMKDMFGVEQSRSPRLLWIFRGLLYFLYSISDTPTFLDLYFLLSELLSSPSRVKGMMKSGDEVLSKTADAMAELEPTAFTAVMNRISNFVMPAGSFTSRTFCTRKSTVDFLKMVSEPGVYAFRLARNILPEDFRSVLTSTVILNVFYAVEKRKKIFDSTGKELFPVHLIVDEFQTVASLETLEVILSEARKFGLFLVTANQHLTQIPEALLKSLEGNSRLIFSFRVGPDDAKELAKVMGNPDLEQILTTLPNYTAIVKRVDKVYIFRVPKAEYGDEIKALESIKRDVKLEEDRKPIYASAFGRGPPMTPAQWAVLSYLFVHAPQVSYEALKNEMFKKYAWDESVTLSALNYLMDSGYVRASRSLSGIYYEASRMALERFFLRTEEVISKRAGGAEHNAIARALIRRFWEAGYWVEADTGEPAEEKPDLLVFRPIEEQKASKEIMKKVRDPENWDVPVAYEIETLSNDPSWIRHNLEKNREKGYHVVFVVSDEEKARKLREILGQGEYSVLVVPLQKSEAS